MKASDNETWRSDTHGDSSSSRPPVRAGGNPSKGASGRPPRPLVLPIMRLTGPSGLLPALPPSLIQSHHLERCLVTQVVLTHTSLVLRLDIAVSPAPGAVSHQGPATKDIYSRLRTPVGTKKKVNRSTRRLINGRSHAPGFYLSPNQRIVALYNLNQCEKCPFTLHCISAMHSQMLLLLLCKQGHFRLRVREQQKKLETFLPPSLQESK